MLVAFAIRLAVMGFVYPERLDPSRDHWHFAGEVGRIARSIATRHGFSSPLFADTGPTAWMGPIFPYLLAGVFKIFGVYTRASLFAILTLDCLFSALTCIPVYFIARKTFDERVAYWSACAWAIFPYSIFFAADFVWPTTLSTFLLGTLFAAALYLQDSARLGKWAAFGLMYGIAALNDPVVISVFPVLLLWPVYRRLRRGVTWLIPCTTAVLAFLLLTSAWTVRNYETFHQLIPVRGGMGLEFYGGNNKDTWHWRAPGYHPSDNAKEWSEYQQLGELAFMKKKQAQAFAFIGAHPGLYIVQSLRRVVYVWTGFWSFDKRYLAEEPMDPYNMVFCTALTLLCLSGLWKLFQQNPGLAALYSLTFFFFPLAYYFTHPDDYHRRPIDPLFVVLAVFALVSYARSRSEPERVEELVAA